jgi:ArsR family transcriptional regulator
MNRQSQIAASPSCAHDDAAHGTAPRAARPALAAATVERAAGMLRAAGDPARLRLLDLLAGGERCVTEIAEHTGDAMPTVSQRLQLLRREGLLAARRDGKHVFYALADAHVLELLDNALRHAGEHA